MAASAQTTVTLPAVTHGTIRGGSYADSRLGDLMSTRSDDNHSNERRILLKFDTQNRVPEGSHVTSATLTVTVKSGSTDATRRVAAYQVTQSFSDNEFTWNRRKTTTKWISPGADLGSELAVQNVGNVAGTKVKWDVTSLVQKAVSGSLGSSRYTRIALIDLDSASAASYRVYHTPTDSSLGARPTLTVTYGSGSGTPSASSTTGSTLRVLQWNTHHGGVGTDGKKDPNRLMSWVAKINPDIVSLNEVEYYSYGNSDDPSVFQALLEKKTGRKWYKLFAQASGNWSAHGNGNLILSKYPFVSTSKHALPYTRSIAQVHITVNGRIINFASTHLDADSSGRRLSEISSLKSWFGNYAQQRIVAGDFNAWPGSSENSSMKTSYKDSWGLSYSAGTSVAYPGNTVGNTRNSRIDYVYYSSSASSLVLKYSQVFDTRNSSGVMPSDHRPVLSVFTVK